MNMVHMLASYVDGALVDTASMVLMKTWWFDDLVDRIALLYCKKKLLLKIYKRFDDVVVSTAPGNYITMLKD